MKLLGYLAVIAFVTVTFMQSEWLQEKVFGTLAEAIDPDNGNGQEGMEESVRIEPSDGPATPYRRSTPASIEPASPPHDWLNELDTGMAHPVYVYQRGTQACFAIRQEKAPRLRELFCR
jgi:hypothetical protein